MNPNVKTEWTQAELDLIAAQVDKYYRVEQGDDPEEVFPIGNNDDCFICWAVDGDCRRCPIDTRGWAIGCIKQRHYVRHHKRCLMTRKQARARRIELERIIHESGAGIQIYTVDE